MGLRCNHNHHYHDNYHDDHHNNYYHNYSTECGKLTQTDWIRLDHVTANPIFSVMISMPTTTGIHVKTYYNLTLENATKDVEQIRRV